jgi:PEGA domain
MSFFAGSIRIRGLLLALALAALAATLAGCVERRMTIRSNPPGAQVYVDDYEIGTTPVATSFIYYGTRKIRLVKDGFETLTVFQPMPPPWYGWPGIDFFSENIWPHKIRDERVFEYQMTPTVVVPNEELQARAEQLRAASLSMSASAAPPAGLPPTIAAPAAAPPPTELPPPGTVYPPSTVYPPATTVPTLPPTGAPSTIAPQNLPPNLTPPGSYPPPGGYGPAGGYPAPSALPPAGTYPPAGAPANTAPLYQPPPQQVVPPGWRPIGETPSDTIQR